MIEPFLLRALLASLMVGILLGLLSPLINFKGLAFLTHATFHALLFGTILGMIVLLLTGWSYSITLVSLFVTIVVVMGIAGLERKGFMPDSAVGIMASFVAGLTILGFGVLYSLMASKPYYPLSENIISYLTGEIFLVTLGDLTFLVVAGIVVVFIMLVFYRDFLYTSFDPEGIESLGGNVRFYLSLMYFLVGFVSALVVKSVGLITLQVIAVLPGAISARMSRDLREIVGLSLVLTILTMILSLLIAYPTGIPPSGIATLFLGAIYIATARRGVS